MSEAPGLKQRINDDLRNAIRNRDNSRRDVLRMLLAAIINTEKAQGTTLDDAGVIGAVGKGVKVRGESLAAFRDGNRPELAAVEETALAILGEYLPEQINRDEIIAAAKRIITETGATGLADKGKVMPKIMAELKGKADGRELNQVVTELLSA